MPADNRGQASLLWDAAIVNSSSPLIQGKSLLDCAVGIGRSQNADELGRKYLMSEIRRAALHASTLE